MDDRIAFILLQHSNEERKDSSVEAGSLPSSMIPVGKFCLPIRRVETTQPQLVKNRKG